ncbi:hypothetical protein ACLKA6_015981 [Drosophila palustris]
MLASGSLQRHVASSYRISKQHMGVTIDLVCDAICAGLSGEFPKWTKQSMLKWAEDFETKWNFPNCIGAIDGKHVPIKSPPNSGSAFYNYKGFHSIVLTAVCDASYRFTYIDVAAQTKLAELQTFRGRYQDYPKYVRINVMEYVNSPTGSVSWQDEAAGV